MIRRTALDGRERIEFVLASTEPVSVVGDFNRWDALAGGMSLTGNGRRHLGVTLAPGRYAFRYVNHEGAFYDDPDADGFEPNGHGQTHGLVIVDEITSRCTDHPAGPPALDLSDRRRSAAAQDDRIGQWFRHAMDGHPYLAHADIEYFVEDQVIHLEGSVGSRLAKQALWDLAWGVREIRDVDVRIAIATHR